jgi:exopolysaccharide biosynthesis protein
MDKKTKEAIKKKIDSEIEKTERVIVEYKEQSKPISPENAIGGGPRILREGKVSIELSQENFGVGKAFYIKNSRHPRSAVGINRDEKTMFLVVVEGRSAESQGMNMKELAKLLLSLGATEAMAFDGGRSVSMYAAGKEVVKGDRQMADALGVFKIKP